MEHMGRETYNVGMNVIWITAAAAGLCGLPLRYDTTVYTIRTGKVTAPLRFCVLADVHCRPFGRHHARLMRIIRKMRPDAVLVPGDLFDVDRDYEVSFDLMAQLKDIPVYFTAGNHDNYLDELPELTKRLETLGVTVLDNASACLQNGKDTVEIAGLHDLGRKAKVPVSAADDLFHTGNFRILLSHRPCHTDYYSRCACDLIVSGHAHGGQWCIPFTRQGLYVKEEGIFPKYTHGMIDLNGRRLVISRGLASGDPRIPRMYNPPEIVFIDLVPEQ